MLSAKRTSAALIGAALSTFAIAPLAQAANVTFFQFMVEPDLFLPSPPEFSYDPLQGLTAGSGAAGNGSFFSPGMMGMITGGLPGIASSPPGVPGYGPPYRLLSDLTLELSSFTPVGPAVTGSTSTTQNLAGGSFVVKYTPKDFLGQVTGPDLVLLTGSTASAQLDKSNSGSVGSVLAGVVTYTGGLIFDSFAAAGLSNTGSFSFNLSGIANPTAIDPLTGHLAPFLADGGGTFDAAPIALPPPGPAVPLPQSVWAGIGLTGFLVIARHRRASRQA